MYEYRILFPRVGANEIRRELTTRPTTDAQRRHDECLRPAQRTRKGRS